MICKYCRVLLRSQLLLSLLCVCFSELAAAQPSIDPTHFVPVEKNLSSLWKKRIWQNEKKIYKGNELNTIGMPCGGIAAGQLYVRGDGTLANWWICNNAYNTGYGIDSLMKFNTALGPWKVCYQTFTPPAYIDQGFSIEVKYNAKKVIKRLNKNDFDDISFTGEYPLAKINYASKSDPLPLTINMEVFSPFIPLDAKESATPGTIMKYTLQNNSGKQMDISLTGWLQNLVCLDLKKQISANSRNTVIKNKGITTVFMDIIHPEFLGTNDTFSQNHPYLGNISLSILDDKAFADADFNFETGHHATPSSDKKIGEKLLGATGTSLSLAPNQKKEVTFLLTWYFPNRPSYYYGADVTNVIPNNWNEAVPTKGATILGNMYANWFNSSTDVALWLQKNLARLSGETHKFHDAYYNQTTLPYWLAQRLLMPVSTLATETCQWWADGKFWAWEGVGSCVGTCTHVWNYEQALARLFPGLERNIREITDFGTSFQKDGSILARNGWGDVLIDGDAGAILKAYREHLFSKDGLFLSRNWPKIKKATEYLISEDENEDGLIEKKQANTYDIAFFGANTYVGSLYLAALKATAAMANIMHDSSFATKCLDIFSSGSKKTVEKLWDGQYFKQDVDLAVHPKFQYADGCLSDQLFGQTWSHLVSLGYIYPEKNVKSALDYIWKYNWAPDVALQSKYHPPERVYANAGEAGLLVCTWPKSRHMGDSGVRYRDEVWTGIEYQVATNMIYENMVDEGLSIVKAVHERYDPVKHNPWNEIECGDHYARAMASWGVLMALEDYYYNGPDKKIGFSPNIQQDHFKSFFTSAEAWGNLEQERTAASQTNTITVRYGKLDMQSFETKLTVKPRTVTVFADGIKKICKYTFNDNQLLVSFPELNLSEGSSFKVIAEK